MIAKLLLWVAAGGALASCTKGLDPVLACQQRIVAAPQSSDSEDDGFGAKALAKVDRAGCSAKQLALLDRLQVLSKAMPALHADNEKAAASGDDDAHMAAFQAMNNAVIEFNDLMREAREELAAMEAKG